MPDTTVGGAEPSRGITVRDVHVDLDGGPVLRGVDLDAHSGSQLAILGPSGCGKTTLLRALAGLQRLDSGTVHLGERLVAGPGVHVPPEHRSVGLVFQEWALFPHLSVAANVAYGLPRSERMAGLLSRRRRSRLAARVGPLLEMVGIADLVDRLPGSLSGGQQQRVALARALAPRPSVLLLDEPFSSLDTNLRAGVRADVAALLRELGVTAVFVTHDQDEAFVLGDEVAVMREGLVVQQAAPAEIYQRPADRWLAGFVGEADLLEGTARDAAAETILGRVPLTARADGAVEVLLRPEDVVLVDGDDATVTAVEYHGHDALTVVRLDDGVELRSRITGAPAHVVGDRVCVAHRGKATVAFPVAETEPATVRT